MLIIFLIFEFFIIGVFLYKNGLIDINEKEGKNKIAVVNMNKVITSAYIFKTIDKIEKIVNKDEYKEILFIMNSPGGSPTASEEMSNYLREINKVKKITMYVGGYALSGGYYIASAIKPLKANKNALVGSIGVILQHYNISKLAQTIGIEENTITKGKFKQPLSIFKKTDENQTKYLNENMLQPTYHNFIEAVAINRGLDYNTILKYAEGMIFVANSPKIKGILVDEITSLYKIRADYKKRFGKNVKFINITKEKKPFNLLNTKVDFNLGQIKSKISY
jgi:protease-4